MTQARKALFIAPDDVPWEFDDYAAACQALNLEPNRHCYVVCRVSTAAGTRTLLTADLGLLQDTEKADKPRSGQPAYRGPVPAAPAWALTPCQRELKAEKDENAGLRGKLEDLVRRRQLEEQVEELQRQLEGAKRPYRPIRPYGDMSPGPSDQGPGGSGFGP
jgi:hypothetical protein